jgi:hypothetical protein
MVRVRIPAYRQAGGRQVSLSVRRFPPLLYRVFVLFYNVYRSFKEEGEMKATKGIALVGILAFVPIACSSTAFKVNEQDSSRNRDNNKKIWSLRRDFPQCGEPWFRQVESMDEEKQKWLSDDDVGIFALGWKAGGVEGIIQLTSDPLIQPCDILSSEELEHIRDRRNWIIIVVQGVKDIASWFGGKIVDAVWNPDKNGEVLVKEQCFSGETKIRRVFKDGKIAIEH